MKEGWEYKKLGEVVLSSDLGKTLNQSKDTGTLRPYLCAINILWDKIDLSSVKETRFEDSEIERYSVSKGDLLICEGGDTGRSAIWESEEPMLYQNALHRIRFNDEIYPRYALFFLRHLKNIGDIDQKYSKGVTIKHLVKSSLLSIPIKFPPLEAQQSIVSELDLINELIAKKKAQLADLDSLAQSLFYEMFGDPVENEKGWEVKKLGEVCYAQNGLVDPRVSPYDEMLHVGPANIVSHTGELVGLNKAKEENLISGKYLFRPGMLLYSKIRPNLNKVTIAHFEGICSADMYPLICNENVNEVYLLYILRSKCFLDYAITNSGRANIPKINRESLFAFKLPLPPLSLQQTFASRIEAIEEEKQKIQSSLKDLETLLASRMQYWFD